MAGRAREKQAKELELLEDLPRFPRREQDREAGNGLFQTCIPFYPQDAV
jgi:hypothetical protein